MRAQMRRLLTLSMFVVTILAWPVSGSAQVFEDACVAKATLEPVPAGTNRVNATVSYTCGRSYPIINVSGCLVYGAVPVFCDGQTRFESNSASAPLSFPCTPGLWSVVAVGAGGGRTLPAGDVGDPLLVTDCDPLGP